MQIAQNYYQTADIPLVLRKMQKIFRSLGLDAHYDNEPILDNALKSKDINALSLPPSINRLKKG